MANEKGQGASSAEVNNVVSAYRLMESGAFDDGGLLLDAYATTHEIDDEVAPVFLAYVFRDTDVAMYLEGHSTEVKTVDIVHATEKGEMLCTSIEALESERKTKLLHSYMPLLIAKLIEGQTYTAEEIYAFLHIFGEEYAKSMLLTCVRREKRFYKRFAPLLGQEEVLEFALAVLEPLYIKDKAAYGKELLALGRAAVEAGCFESARSVLENAAYHLKDLSECRFLQLLATLEVSNEFEFLRAENFSKQMPEYIQLLVACSANQTLAKHYTELAEKNLSGEYYGTDYIPTRDGDYIYFGEYPQTLKAADVKVSSKPDERGYYIGSDGAYYKRVSAVESRKGEIEFSNGEILKPDKTYYFKVEPIRWKILVENIEENKILVFCDRIIDCRRAHYRINDYGYSELRGFLTGEFYQTAFTEKEQDAILVTTVDNSTKSTGCATNCNVCSDTEDKIFPFSVEEITRVTYGFPADDRERSSNRGKLSTDYVTALGNEFYMDEGVAYGSYWLRSPQRGYNSSSVLFDVISRGLVSTHSVMQPLGICPAMWISLDKLSPECTIRRAPVATPKAKAAEKKPKGKGESAPEAPKAPKGEGKTFDWKSWKLPIGIGLGGVALIVALCILIPLLFPAMCGAGLGGANTSYEMIELGEYPQTIKASDVTVGTQKDARGYYLGSDGAWYAKVENPAFAGYYTFADGREVPSTERVVYFKVEPIRWRVIENDGGKKLLLCDSILDAQSYDTETGLNIYTDCTLHMWLNEEFFLSAFSDAERVTVVSTYVDNSAKSTGSWGNPNASYNTTDNVFLLSVEEVTKAAYGLSDPSFRRMRVSDYALARGAQMSTDESTYGMGRWWLRSPSSNEVYLVRYVDGFGDAKESFSAEYRLGIVPAIHYLP